MPRHPLRRLRPALVLALLPLAGCGSADRLPLTLDQRYQSAVRDAEVAELGEVSRSLQRIVPENKRLRWRSGERGPQVLLVTWTSWAGYDADVGRPTTLAREVWVTCVPELREFMANRPETLDRELRAAQVLGLPPQPNKTRFVELWVDPADLFRPAANPNVTADTVPPDSQPGLPLPAVGWDFAGWYAALRAVSYAADGYPWTRLGYTYDWGDPRDEEGLSEFVVRAGARVDVAAAVANAAYLGGN